MTFFCAARKQFAQQTFARTQVGDDERRQNPQKQMSERLPRAARPVDAIETSGDLIEINLRLFAAAIHDALEIDLVVRMFGQFLRAANRELDEFGGRAAGLRIQFVESPFAFAPRLHEAGILQQTEMRRDARLAEPRDFLKFVHGKLVVFQQRYDAQACGVGQGSQ